MRILILLFTLFILNVCLYAQDTNINTNMVNNNIPASENAIMQINRFDARRNPVSFINLVNFTPFYVLREYARVNNIEIYPYDTEATLRARIIERQVNVKAEMVSGSEQVKEVARTTINRGGAQVELIGADFVERYEIKEADEEKRRECDIILETMLLGVKDLQKGFSAFIKLEVKDDVY